MWLLRLLWPSGNCGNGDVCPVSSLNECCERGACSWVNDVGSYLKERSVYKVAFEQKGVGDDQYAVIDAGVPIKQYVDVNDAVGIVLVNGFVCTPHSSFDGLGDIQQFVWGVRSVDSNHCIEKHVIGAESPWRALNEG